MDQSVLLTGFPGFIATRLLRRLAVDTKQLTVLVQPRFLDLARTRIDEIAPQTCRQSREFQVVVGDVTRPDLGVTATELEKLRSETTIIFHLAALYDLATPREAAIQVNLEGTRNVNQFARTVTQLRHYHYVSTCYVAGMRKGLILESELRHDAGFRNYYEESKYLAELEVDALKAEIPLTIHRPAVVCGDSKNGETEKYDGVYYLIHYLLQAPRLLSPFNIGNDEVSLNLVPVDFVVESLAALANDDRALSKTLQIADPNPLTTRQLFNVIAQSILGRSAILTVPPRIVEFTLMLPPSPRITGLPHHGVPYFFLKQFYDSTEAQRILGAHRLYCPPFDTYVDRIVSYAAQHPVV